MEAYDPRPTRLERKIQDAHSNYLLDIEKDDTLRSLMRLLRYVLAQHATELHDLPPHEICNEQGIQEQFDAFIQGLIDVWGQPPAWEEKPLVWEQWLVYVLVEKIKKQLPKMYEDFGDGLPHLLRFAAGVQLEATTRNKAYGQAMRDLICQSVPLSFEKIPWNPIHIDYDHLTGRLDLKSAQSATIKDYMEVNSLIRIFQPKKQPGRPKGIPKSARSGRKASVEPSVYIAAWEAKQGARERSSIPWHLAFARKRNMLIPETDKGRDALRKKLEEWALKGKTLARKK